MKADLNQYCSNIDYLPDPMRKVEVAAKAEDWRALKTAEAAVAETLDRVIALLAWHSELTAARKTPSAPAAAGLLDCMVKRLQDYKQDYVTEVAAFVTKGAE